tara:strand:- start:1605 stop:2780 length:1176 start_codon:yes stop_codon:yes gene_type:complete
MKVRLWNRLYDISDFAHPGGGVIRTHAWCDETQIDATNAFVALHARSKRAFHVLKTLPSYPLEVQRNMVEKDFEKMNIQITQAGFYKPSYNHVCYRVLSNAFMWLSGGILLRNGLFITSVLIFSISYMQCGWIQHECGHKSFTGHSTIDRLLQIVYLDIFMGGNHHFWNDQHFSHHANTHNFKLDKDLKTHPLVAFDKSLFKTKSHTIFTRYQHLLYWCVINPLVWFTWSFLSYPLFAYNKGHLAQYITTKLLSFLIYIGFFRWCNFSTAASLCMFHLVSMIGTGLLLSTFTISHTPTDAYESNCGWVIPAASHTINVHNHWLTNWWMGYLNFQIEHHLFPTMPQFRQSTVGDEYIKPFFKKHDLKYIDKSFYEANHDVYMNLKKVAEFAN